MRHLAPLAILLAGCPKPPAFDTWEAVGAPGEACERVRTPEQAARQLLLEHPERVTIRLAPQELDPAWALHDLALLEAGVGHPTARAEIEVTTGGGTWSECPIYECTDDWIAERVGVGGPTLERPDPELILVIALVPILAPLALAGPLTGPWAAPGDFPEVTGSTRIEDAQLTRFALTRVGPAEGPPEVRWSVRWEHDRCEVTSTWAVPLPDAPLSEALEATGLSRGIPLVSARLVDATAGEVVAGPVMLPPAEVGPAPAWPGPVGTAPAELCGATDAATVRALGASDLPCESGRTPLWSAVFWGRGEVVEALLDGGADRVHLVPRVAEWTLLDPAVRERLLAEPSEQERVRFTIWADQRPRFRVKDLEEQVPGWFEPVVRSGWDEIDAARVLDEPFAPHAVATLGLSGLAAWRARFPTCALCRDVDPLPIERFDPPSRVAALAGPPEAVEEGSWLRRETWPDGWAEYVRMGSDERWGLVRVALPAVDPFGGAVAGMPIDGTWVALGPWAYLSTPGDRFWYGGSGEWRYRLEEDGEGRVARTVVDFGRW